MASIRLSVLLATLLSVQLKLVATGGTSAESLDVTRFFSLEASSTCGETPPSPGSGSGDGLQVSSCLPGERNASFALDSDVETWWQSGDGDSPVELTFSLQNVNKLNLSMQYTKGVGLNSFLS